MMLMWTLNLACAAAAPQADTPCMLHQVLRKHRDTINTMLEPCVHDPMTEWHTPTHTARSTDAEAVARDALRIVAGERQKKPCLVSGQPLAVRLELVVATKCC